MKKIIALQGPPSAGKTTSIGKLIDTMCTEGYEFVLPKARKGSRDFFVILRKNNKFIGITTYGKTASLIKYRIALFLKENCSIIVCACNEAGTVSHRQIKSYRTCTIQYIPKSVVPDEILREPANNSDAALLFKAIDESL